MDDNSYNHSDSNEMDGISVVLMGAVHSGNDRVAEKVMKHCIKTRKDIVIQQQAKPSKMQAASHIM